MKKKLIIICIVSIVFWAVASAQATPNTGIAYYKQGGSLSNTCDYDWWHGCSPTSAGMMMGYYDRNGYNSLTYDNLVSGGMAETNTFGAGPYLANNAIASSGHISDFYGSGYGASGDDVSQPWHSFDCLADFMGTSQDSVGNSNGSTTFYYFTSGAAFHDYHALSYNVWDEDGMYGIGEYVTYAGYDTAGLYTQLTDNMGQTYGFTFNDYKAEIDTGRPVMIHVSGHSMLGYGYIDGTNTINVYDTWTLGGTYNSGTMTWGGSYASLNLVAVTAMELTGGSIIPAPGAILLGSIGIGLVGWLKRRRTL